MNVREIMTSTVETCRWDDDLARAAQIMWEHDCGCVPVVDHEQKVVGVLTDRDICMAAYTQGRKLSEIPVSTAAAHKVLSCTPDDAIETAEAIMRNGQVRRLPVLDGGGRLAGMLSLGDVARHVSATGKGNGLSTDSIAFTLAAISQAPPGPAAQHAG
jgi:CBS domain-containing protein